MSKKLLTFSLVLIGTQLIGCSAVQNYIPLTPLTSQLYQAKPAFVSTSSLQYDFIEPRRTELSPEITSKLDNIADNQQKFTYYSASGHRCYTLSLSPLQAACKINDRWEELAPILNNYNE